MSVREMFATDEKAKVEVMLARLMYLTFCERKGTAPYKAPYLPSWALDYAEVAVRYLGFDDEGIALMEKDIAR